MRPRIFVSLAAVTALVAASPLFAQTNCPVPNGEVRVGAAPPPPLPQYSQPPIPAYGYVWTPGYWAWNVALNDYYWVAGTWVAPPAAGLLWTPGYWAFDGGVYLFRPGYWGPHVGFYGGVAYGFGYWGHGYDGGYWQGRTFYYNRVYNNLGAVHINAVYERRVPYDRLVGRSSFNGPGGVRAVPTDVERSAAREAHVTATVAQAQHIQTAAADDHLRAGVNHGHPDLPPPAQHVASSAPVSPPHAPIAPPRHIAPAQVHGMVRVPENPTYHHPVPQHFAEPQHVNPTVQRIHPPHAEAPHARDAREAREAGAWPH